MTTHYDQEIDNECGEGIYVLRTFEAIDGCGNMSVATQEIHFSYNQGPSLEIINPLLAGLVSGDTISMPCGFNYPNSITGFGPDDVVFAEDCASNIEIHFTETIITENDCEGGFAQTLVLLTWQGENACAANSQIEIFVNLYDEEVPTILNFEEKMMLSCGDEIPEVIVTDNCSKVEVFIEEYEYIVGRCPDVLVIKRYIYLVDACGNQVAYDQELIFMDEIGPEIFGIEEEVCNDTSMPDAYAYDACMDAFVELIMSEDTMTGCDDGMLLKRTWSAEDNCRNVTIIEQYIVIDDTIAPTINIFDPWVNYFLNNPIVFTSNVDAMQGLESINLASVLGEDNCDPIIVPVYEALTTMAEDCEADGFYSNHLFSWSFSDNCENTSNLDMNVIVIDNEAPIIENMPEDTTIYCQEMIPPPKLIITDHSEYTIEMYEMSMDSISYYRIWTVTDACGNSTTYEQVIRLDNESDLTCAIESVEEIVYCNTHYNEFAGIATGGTAPYTYEWEALSGVCFLQGSIYEDTVQVYVGFTEIILQLTVTDANGCITICTYTITCTDKADGFTTGIDPGFTEGEIFDNMYCIPNPVYNEMILTFNTSFTGPLSIDIYDALGQHKMTLDKNAVMGINQIPLQMESLNEGQYIMRVFAEGSIGLIRFTKIELF